MTISLDDFIQSIDVKRMLREVRTIVQKDPDLKHTANELSCVLFKQRDKKAFIRKVDELSGHIQMHLKEMSPVFTLYIFEQGLNNLADYYRCKGIPGEILNDTLDDLNIWINNYYIEYGKPGFNQNEWESYLFLGEVFKLGRLQFQIRKYQVETEVYQSEDDLVVVAVQDTPVDSFGEYTSENNALFKTKFDRYNNTLVAHRVFTSSGLIDLQPSTIDLSKYRLILSKSDDVLGIHIPATGKMDFMKCLESFELARQFFADYFPEKHFKAFTCNSWLLSNELTDIVPKDSNIARFSKLFTRNICKYKDIMIYKWIFGFDQTDFDNVIATTTLSKGVQKLLLNGHDVNARGGFFLI